MVTLDDVRTVAADLPRSYEAWVRGCARFRVGQIVYLGFSRDQAEMGFAFPKAWRPALVESEPEKFFLPRESELRVLYCSASCATAQAKRAQRRREKLRKNAL